ncbi:MAG: hypothetical protein V4636_12945 [Pseudomonadota bacterium]
MTSISTNFTAVGVSLSLYLPAGQTATYALSGTFVATLALERTRNGGQTWEPQLSTTTAVSATIYDPGTYRWRCAEFTSGTAVTSMADVADPITGNVTNPTLNGGGQTVFAITDAGIQSILATVTTLATTGAATIGSTLGVTGASTLAALTSTAITNAFTNTATSGSVVGTSIAPTYNQASGTAANTDFKINRVETAVGSGTQRLIDAQVGGVSKFSVSSLGAVAGLSFATATMTAGGGAQAASFNHASGAYTSWAHNATLVGDVGAANQAVSGSTADMAITSRAGALVLGTNFLPRITIAADGTSATLVDGLNIAVNATTGTKLGTATSQKLGFWNATPVIQPAGAAQAAPAAYGTGVFGLDSDANMLALYNLVVAMRTALVDSGLMKGAA